MIEPKTMVVEIDGKLEIREVESVTQRPGLFGHEMGFPQPRVKPGEAMFENFDAPPTIFQIRS